MTAAPGAEIANPIAAVDVTSGPRWYRALHWFGILAAPPIQWLFNRNLFVTPAVGWIDPWVYTGYFLSLPWHLRVFGDTYYATRLGWLVPGFIAHHIFSPLVANYVLHVSFAYVLLFAIYELVGTAVNRHAGMLAALMVGWNPMILAAVGWDYVDGAGIVFIVLSLLCLEKLSRRGAHRWIWALSAGASMTALICSNLFLVVLWPVLVCFLMLRVGFDRWRSVASDLFVAAAGAGTLLIVLASVHARLGGSWLFLAASLRQTREMLLVPNIWRATEYAWVLRANWLVLPIVATAAALVTFIRPRRTGVSFGAAIRISLLLSMGLWVVFELRGLPVLYISYYASYLFPFALLTLLLQGPPCDAGSDERGMAAIEFCLFTLFALAHWLVLSDAGTFWSRVVRHLHLAASPDYVATGACAAACALALVSWRFATALRAQWMLFAVFIVVSYFAVPKNWPSAYGASSPRQFEQTAMAHRFVRANIGDERPRFWYYATPDTPLPFIPLASTYLWGYVLVNQDFPLLTKEQASQFTPGSPLVLLAASLPETERARPALGTFGVDYAVRAQRTFGSGDMSFVVLIANVILTNRVSGGSSIPGLPAPSMRP